MLGVDPEGESMTNTVLGNGIIVKLWPFGLQIRGYRQWGITVLRKRRDEYGGIEITRDAGRPYALCVHLGVIHLYIGGNHEYGFGRFRAVER